MRFFHSSILTSSQSNTAGSLQYFGADYRPVAPTPLRVVSVTPATITAAIADAQPGDRIELTSGTYTGDTYLDGMVGTAVNPIIITPAAGASVNVHEFRLWDTVQHVWIGQFYGENQHDLLMDQGAGTSGGLLVAVGRDDNAASDGTVTDIKLCGIHFDRIGYNHVVIEGSSKRVEVLNCLFERPGISNPDRGEGVYIGEAQTSKLASENEDILVQGCEFRDFPADVIDVKPSNVRGIDILDNWIHDCNFNGNLAGFTNGAIGITQIQARQVRDPEIRILRNVINDITGTGSNMRARAINSWGPAEIANNVMFRIGEEAISLDDDTAASFPPTWWTTGVQYDVHNNTMFDTGLNGGEDPARFSLSTAAAQRLRWVGNVSEGSITLPGSTAESSNNHAAASVDYVGPLAGTAMQSRSHVGSGYQLSSGSSIPGTAGALGKE